MSYYSKGRWAKAESWEPGPPDPPAPPRPDPPDPPRLVRLGPCAINPLAAALLDGSCPPNMGKPRNAYSSWNRWYSEPQWKRGRQGTKPKAKRQLLVCECGDWLYEDRIPKHQNCKTCGKSWSSNRAAEQDSNRPWDKHVPSSMAAFMQQLAGCAALGGELQEGCRSMASMLGETASENTTPARTTNRSQETSTPPGQKATNKQGLDRLPGSRGTSAGFQNQDQMHGDQHRGGENKAARAT